MPPGTRQWRPVSDAVGVATALHKMVVHDVEGPVALCQWMHGTVMPLRTEYVVGRDSSRPLCKSCVKAQNPDYPVEITPVMNANRNSASRAESLRREAQAMLLEADRLANLPKEPIDADPAIIYFEKAYNGRTFKYAGVKAGGAWFLTGPSQTGRRYTWDQLVSWICDAGPVEIWLAQTLIPVE